MYTYTYVYACIGIMTRQPGPKKFTFQPGKEMGFPIKWDLTRTICDLMWFGFAGLTIKNGDLIPISLRRKNNDLGYRVFNGDIVGSITNNTFKGVWKLCISMSPIQAL